MTGVTRLRVPSYDHFKGCFMGVNNQFDESRLLISLKSGDIRAFETLYFFYSKRLYGNILKVVKSTEITEELVQELFQRIWERRHAIDLTKSFKSYLFTIARHLVYDFLHRQVKQRHLEAHLVATATSSYHHIDNEIAYKEAQSIISDGIRRLPPQRRQVYVLCKIQGRSYEDVSRLLGISPSTISDHIVKATKAIRSFYLSEHALVLFLLHFFF